MSNVNSSPNQTPTSFVHVTRFVAVCCLGGLMLITALVSFLFMHQQHALSAIQAKMAEQAKAQEAATLQASAARQQRLKFAQAAVTAALQDTRKQMDDTIKAGRDKAAGILLRQKGRSHELVSRVDDKIQGYGNAFLLTKCMAKDKIWGSHETTDYLREAFRPMVTAQVETATGLQQTLQECADSLTLQAAHLQVSLAQAITDEFKPSDLGLQGNLEQLITESSGKALQSSMDIAAATMEAAIEALLIQTTYDIATGVLAKVVSKEVFSLSVGAGGAAIPGIDIITTIIAVGGTAWTSYDIISAIDGMRKVDPVIGQDLTNSTTQLEKKTDVAFSDLENKVVSLFK